METVLCLHMRERVNRFAGWEPAGKQFKIQIFEKIKQKTFSIVDNCTRVSEKLLLCTEPSHCFFVFWLLSYFFYFLVNRQRYSQLGAGVGNFPKMGFCIALHCIRAECGPGMGMIRYICNMYPLQLMSPSADIIDTGGSN